MDIKKKRRAYLSRKRRSNTIARSQDPDYRCIAIRSLKHIGVQLIDREGNVLVSANDSKLSSGTKKEKARQVGLELAKKALDKKITHCVFDRNGFLYHGRVQELCEGLREGGLTV